jgi:hypothetical protein
MLNKMVKSPPIRVAIDWWKIIFKCYNFFLFKTLESKPIRLGVINPKNNKAPILKFPFENLKDLCHFNVVLTTIYRP